MVLPISLSSWECCPGSCLLKKLLLATLLKGRSILRVKITCPPRTQLSLIRPWPWFSRPWVFCLNDTDQFKGLNGLLPQVCSPMAGAHYRVCTILELSICQEAVAWWSWSWTFMLGQSPVLSKPPTPSPFPSICNCALGLHTVRDSYWSGLETYLLFLTLLLLLF